MTLQEINNHITNLQLSLVHVNDGSLSNALEKFNKPILEKIEQLKLDRLNIFNSKEAV